MKFHGSNASGRKASRNSICPFHLLEMFSRFKVNLISLFGVFVESCTVHVIFEVLLYVPPSWVKRQACSYTPPWSKKKKKAHLKKDKSAFKVLFKMFYDAMNIHTLPVI